METLGSIFGSIFGSTAASGTVAAGQATGTAVKTGAKKVVSGVKTAAFTGIGMLLIWWVILFLAFRLLRKYKIL